MSDLYDVVIVGARVAGSPLAVELAREGERVCLVDQARFPSDTASTHIVQPSGVKLLGRLGVLDRLLAVTPAIERISVRLDDALIEASDVPGAFGAPGLCIRRVTLDQVLLETATAAGVDVRTRTPVLGLLRRDGRVTGVRTSGGDIRARVVVGADGVNSTIARLTGASEYAVTRPGRAFIWSYFDAPSAPRGEMWFGKQGDHGFLASPTDAGQFLAAVGVPMAARDDLRGGREEPLRQGLRRWPELAEALTGAKRVGPVRATIDWRGYFRTSAGPGWVLVGDAGHFKDPTPGQGITDALRQARRLAGAIRDSLGAADAADADEPLRAWWRWRDRDAWDMYWFAHDMGAPDETPPVLQEMLRRIAADPASSAKLFQVLDHGLAPSKVMTLTLLLRSAATALRRRAAARRDIGREVASLLADSVRREVARRRTPPAASSVPVSTATVLPPGVIPSRRLPGVLGRSRLSGAERHVDAEGG